jgi:Uma2 family endonuclease
MPRAEPLQRAASFEEFLEFESHSQERHEFVDDNLFVRAGGTDRHNLIALLLHALIFRAARATGCWAYANDVLIKVPSGFGFYPDLFVVQDASHDEPRVKHHPSIIIEVLSESTEATDRGEKWQQYQTIPSLEMYVLLPQDQAGAEVFTRQNDGSWRYQKLNATASLEFPSLNLSVALDEMYRDLPEG